MSLGLADVKDAFHRFRLPEGLASFSGLGTATAGELNVVGHIVGGAVLGIDEGHCLEPLKAFWRGNIEQRSW